MSKWNAIFSFMWFLLFFLPGLGFAIGVEVGLGVWHQGPDGYISYKGESLDVEDELKYDGENRVIARAKIDMPLSIPNIYLMLTPMDFDKSGIKNTSFTFGDIIFQGDVPFFEVGVSF